MSHQLSSRNGGDAGQTRRATEASAGVFRQYVEEANRAQRSLGIRRCSRQLGRADTAMVLSLGRARIGRSYLVTFVLSFRLALPL
jgi:hypothetical protein